MSTTEVPLFRDRNDGEGEWPFLGTCSECATSHKRDGCSHSRVISYDDSSPLIVLCSNPRIRVFCPSALSTKGVALLENRPCALVEFIYASEQPIY